MRSKGPLVITGHLGRLDDPEVRAVVLKIAVSTVGFRDRLAIIGRSEHVDGHNGLHEGLIQRNPSLTSTDVNNTLLVLFGNSAAVD